MPRARHPAVGPGDWHYLEERQRRAAEVYTELRIAGIRTKEIRDAFCARLKARFKVDMPWEEFTALRHTNNFRKYVHALTGAPDRHGKERLKAETDSVIDDYFWARMTARAAGDYRETRVAASDHLDRVGLTEKQNVPLQAVQIILGERFDDKPVEIKARELTDGSDD